MTLFKPELAEGRVVHHRAQALLDRVADDAVDLGLGVDLVVGEVVLHHAVLEHPRGEDPFGIEARRR